MNETVRNEHKKSKKKSSVFSKVGEKLQLKKLITRLSQSHEANSERLIQQIIQSRNKKIDQIRKLKSKFILQKPMIPTSPVDRFSYQKPISSGQKFLNQKIRENILAPDRMYTHQPNIRAGSLDQSKMINYASNEDKRVINVKFQQYIRIVEQQSGISKRKRMSDISNESYSLPTIASPFKISMKKTYFKKYQSDQYNFYKPPIKQITRVDKIFQLTNLRTSTEKSRQRSRLISSSITSSPRAYQTLQTGLSKDTSQYNLNLSTLKNANNKTVKILDSYRF